MGDAPRLGGAARPAAIQAAVEVLVLEGADGIRSGPDAREGANGPVAVDRRSRALKRSLEPAGTLVDRAEDPPLAAADRNLEPYVGARRAGFSVGGATGRQYERDGSREGQPGKALHRIVQGVLRLDARGPSLGS